MEEFPFLITLAVPYYHNETGRQNDCQHCSSYGLRWCSRGSPYNCGKGKNEYTPRGFNNETYSCNMSGLKELQYKWEKRLEEYRRLENSRQLQNQNERKVDNGI